MGIQVLTFLAGGATLPLNLSAGMIEVKETRGLDGVSFASRARIRVKWLEGMRLAETRWMAAFRLFDGRVAERIRRGSVTCFCFL